MDLFETIFESLGGVIIALCFLGSIIFVLYKLFSFIILLFRGLISAPEDRRRKNQIKRVFKLKDKYPEAYAEWYPNDLSPKSLSDDELNERLTHQPREWREKQKVLDENRKSYNLRMTKVNDLCAKYPYAYKEVLGKKLIDYDRLQMSKTVSLLEKPLPRLSPNLSFPADFKPKPQRFVSNKYSLNEREVSILLEMPESKLSEIEARIVYDYTNKCQEISRLYPYGLETYKKKYPSSTIIKWEIVEYESEIKELEQYYHESQLYETQQREQESLTDILLNIEESFYDNWGYSHIQVARAGINRMGCHEAFPSKILHVFMGCVCMDTTLDYSLVKDRVHQQGEMVFTNTIQKSKIASFISQIPNVTILTSEGRFEDNWDFVKDIIESDVLNEVPVYTYSDFLADDDIRPEKVLLLQAIASDEELKQKSDEILGLNKCQRTAIACISLLREFTSHEMKELIIEEEARINEEKEKQEKELEKERLYWVSHTNKNNWAEIRDYLKWNGVSYFYHFTDKANLDSIREHGGLFSWKYCEDHNISIPRAGGSDFSRRLDERHNLEDYVRLSFCEDHPMAYRLKQEGYDLVLLKINVCVAWLQDTLFSDMNAADSSHHHGGTLEDLKLVDIPATKEHYVSQDSPYFKKHQAEVLVKSFIPIEYITMPGHIMGVGIESDQKPSPTKSRTDVWKVKEIRNFTEQEINAVESNVIVPSDFGNSIRFNMKNGGATYIPLSTKSTKGVGESIDLTIAKLITLEKPGAGEIYRVEI